MLQTIDRIKHKTDPTQLFANCFEKLKVRYIMRVRKIPRIVKMILSLAQRKKDCFASQEDMFALKKEHSKP